MTDALVRSESLMGTVVTMHVVGHGATEDDRTDRLQAIQRAFEWMHEVESRCTRFDETSEVRRLSERPGEAVHASELLFRAVQFALALAEETGGAFDPAVGRRLEEAGFNRHYRTGAVTVSEGPIDVSYRDVAIDPAARTITLHRPLVLDLGAVAKGLAIDLAARELARFGNFAIDAGGDLFLGGTNGDGEEWSVGIRHPRQAGILETLHLSDCAVCTSGDYARRDGIAAPHIIDARNGIGATELASVTVIAESALVADALGTAAFILGPTGGLALLERHGVRGVLITIALDRLETPA